MISAPCYAAGQAQSQTWDIQRELGRDTWLIGNFDRGSGGGQVANNATDGAIAEPDDSTFRDKVPRRSRFSTFHHSPAPSIGALTMLVSAGRPKPRRKPR